MLGYEHFLNLLFTKKILKFFLFYPLSLHFKFEDLKDLMVDSR